MDHSAHIPLLAEEVNAANIREADVYGPDDHNIGTVSHMHGMGVDAQVIVDVGGFLGIGAKPVALRASTLNFMRDEAGKVHAKCPMTKDQLKTLPEHKD